MTEIDLDVPVAFSARPSEGGAPVEVRLKHVRGERAERWTSLAAIVETDAETASSLAGRGFFHNTPENRLEEVQGGFNAGLPVKIELALRPERLESLPPPDHDARAWLERLVASDQDLLRENAWNALLVWQEHEVDPSIGGGVMKVGYRTVFSAPRNEIDRLKRHGPVTRTVVEALIENGMPVRFEPEPEAFELHLAVGDSAYACLLHPDDETTAITLTVTADGAPHAEALDEINDELPAGAFEIEGDSLRYVHRIQVDPALVSEGWVIGTLRAGVSVVHHYAPRLLGEPR